MFSKLWRWLSKPSAKYSWALLVVAGGIAGIIFWGGFNTFMEYTNTLDFCISCHEMENTVYEEYKRTAHFANASGVAAICSDCHVPKEWTAKLIRKIRATNELYHKAVGSISTPEKFEAKRLELAERVWASMKANDSRECRNCHSFEAMDFDKQDRRSSEKHPEAIERGRTCIDCHKAVAHKMPPGYED